MSVAEDTNLVDWSQHKAGRMLNPTPLYQSHGVGPLILQAPPAHSPCSIPGVPHILEGAIANSQFSVSQARIGALSKGGKNHIPVASERPQVSKAQDPGTTCHVID